MKRNLLLAALLTAGSLASLVGCGGGEKKGDSYEIAVVTDVGQLMDGGFNQGTYEGAKTYAEANGKTYKYYQPANGADATDADRIAAMNQAIEAGAKVIVTPGFLQEGAIKDVASKNPEVKFLFVDGYQVGLDNVTGISYKEHESGYFAGYAAVMDGYTKLGGTFGGAGANPACNRFAYGYVQGIAAASLEKGVNTEVTISFQNGAAFSASTELQTQISGWYTNGVEVVFSCGGSMLESVKAACAETQNGKIIGVDVDQAGESDRVITSAVKGLSASVEKILGQYYAGEWDSKLANKESKLGASDNATGLPTAQGSWRFTTFTVAQYEALFAKVVSGELNILSDVAADMNNEAAWTALSTDNTTVHFE